jgi:hypothetical protein
METKEIKIKEYHKLVWKTARDNAESYFRSDIWAWIGAAIAAVISGGISLYIQYLWNKTVMIPLWISVLTILGGTVIGLASFVVVLWGWNVFWYMPAKLYREQEKEANKRGWRDIEIKPIRFPANSGLGVGLEILSNKPEQFKINNVCCQINEITHSYDVEFRGNMPIPLLSIPSFQRTHEIINRSQATQLVSGQAIAVAHNDESRAWIQKNDTITDVTIEKDISYKLNISIDGNVLDVGSMDRCALYCDLLYDKNEQTGKMELQLRVIEREPKYENGEQQYFNVKRLDEESLL